MPIHRRSSPASMFETPARTGECLRASEVPGRYLLYLPSVAGWGFPQHQLPHQGRMPAHASPPHPHTEYDSKRANPQYCPLPAGRSGWDGSDFCGCGGAMHPANGGSPGQCDEEGQTQWYLTPRCSGEQRGAGKN